MPDEIQSGTPTIVDETPVVTPSAEAPVTPQVADPSPAADTGEKANPFSKRISEVVQERNYWRQMALQQQQPPPPDPPPAVSNDPDEEPFKTEADFEFDTQKYREYLSREVDRRAAKVAAKTYHEQVELEKQARQRQSFNEKQTEFAAKALDYNDVVSSPINPFYGDILHAIVESDDGPAIAYHIGKNPELAMAMRNMPMRQAVKEIGRIEARLAFEREKASRPPPVSNTPPPPPKIEASQPDVSKDPSEMTDAEFAKWRRRQIAQRR